MVICCVYCIVLYLYTYVTILAVHSAHQSEALGSVRYEVTMGQVK